MENVIEDLKKINAKRVFIQFPEGLKLKIQDIADALESAGFSCFLCLEKTFGACDIRSEEAKRLGCDCILHIGHSDFGIKTDIPVVYWEYFLDVDPLPILNREMEKLKNHKKIGLVASLQFVKTLPKIKSFLEERGKKVFIKKTLKYPGQILGCNLTAATSVEKDVDCFLCISAGKFYGLGLALTTNKPVLLLDLERGGIFGIEEEKQKTVKLIEWNKQKLKDSKRVGVLISWKVGQLKDAAEIKKELELQGKKAYILVADEISPQKLEGLKLDVIVNCACPRIGIDDARMYEGIINSCYLDFNACDKHIKTK